MSRTAPLRRLVTIVFVLAALSTATTTRAVVGTRSACPNRSSRGRVFKIAQTTFPD